MKNRTLHIAFIAAMISGLALSCTNDTFKEESLGANGKLNLKIALSLPGETSSAGTRVDGTTDDSHAKTEAALANEKRLKGDDLRLLIFKNGNLAEEVTDLVLSGDANSAQRYLTGSTSKEYTGSVEAAVFANTESRGASWNSADWIGRTKEEVYAQLTYAYGKKAWSLEAEDAYLPMWGAHTFANVGTGINSATVKMYRGVAKVNVTVNKELGLDNFTLKSVRVYYANQTGYCASIYTPNADPGIQLEQPWVSEAFAQMSISNPLTYAVTGNGIKNRIYVPESNNQAPGENRKPICVVVGGLYTGEGLVDEGKESYYRLDLKNEAGMFDVIRNHLYIFNIQSVSDPGTPTPEEALTQAVIGMNVEITAWTDDFMRGIPDQYTLATSRSIIEFDYNRSVHGSSETSATIDVSTDYEFNEAIGNGHWELADIPAGGWFTVEKVSDGRISVSVNSNNNGVSRIGEFYVQAGNIKKQIVITQQQPETANCYLVDYGRHELIVTIKGNGNNGIYAVSDKGLGNVLLTDANQDAGITPEKIGIIWETQAGLITLIDKNGSHVSGNRWADYDKERGSIDYVVNNNGASIGGVSGGNALIGAFDGSGHVLWSWHIWVCPDMIDHNGNLNSRYVEDWSLNGYQVIDRNLGALSNRPGVTSLGLLYQWGRKDPFIGSGNTNDNYSGTGVLSTQIYHGSWGVDQSSTTSKPMSILQTIQKPTWLTRAGLSNGGEDRSALLWGTDGGLNKSGVKDLGSKTIYDPCPKGYRVPPVDAFVFTTNKLRKYGTAIYTNEQEFQKSNSNYRVGGKYVSVWEWHIWGSDWGSWKYYPADKPWVGKDRHRTADDCQYPVVWTEDSKSSETYNWNENLIYVPHSVSGQSSGNNKLNYNFSGDYVVNAKHYGFYLNYKAIDMPVIKGADYLNPHKLNGDDMYTPESRENVTWLPLSGAYDPHRNSSLTFKNVTIEQGSSITVNSFLWTNSSVDDGNMLRPAAMFLHGTEKGGGGSGRHIHGLTKSDIKAEPQYAGAVRCVRDVQKDFSDSNIVPGTVSLGRAAESSTAITLKSINDTWRVIDPGASWFTITPDNGGADKGRGQTVTFKATITNDTGAARTATVLIKFTNENQPRRIVVTQAR